MKRKAMVLFAAVCFCMGIAGCSGKIPSMANSIAPAASSEAVEKATPIPEPSEIATPEPETDFSIGDTAETETWKMTLSDIEFVEKIESSAYIYYAPKTEGYKYFVARLTIENTGKNAHTFLSSFSYGDDFRTKLLYGDGYEFSRVNLLGYDQDISDKSLNPLSTLSGEIVFEVPPEVENSDEPLTLVFKNTKNSISFKIR